LAVFDKQDRSLIQRMLTGAAEFDAHNKARMQTLLADHPVLRSVFESQQQLHDLWGRTTSNQQARLESVQKWIHDAEQTGIHALEEFAQKLRGYSMVN